jgi:sugar/nucleoside kinase (ribokinase family)
MSASRSSAIAIIGSVSIDTIVDGSDRTRKRGGVTTYAGLACQRLGWAVEICTNTADADAWMLDALKAEGLHVRRGFSPQTTRFINHINGDARQQEMPAAAAPITAELCAEVQASCILLGPLHPNDITAKNQDTLAGSGATIALDLQGHVRRVSKGHVYPAVAPGIEAALRGAHLLKADTDELGLVLAFYACSLPDLMARYDIDELVLTQGSRGGLIHRRDGSPTPYSARPLKQQGDPTGAGDVFFAAYLYHRVHRRQDIAAAAAAAAEIAARQVEGQFIDAATLRLPSAPLA